MYSITIDVGRSFTDLCTIDNLAFWLKTVYGNSELAMENRRCDICA